MTIRHLKTFAEVCAAGGITRAAERLCVAQPSVSQTIAELENFYGVQLFERAGRKLILSSDGERLLPAATEAVKAFSEFEDEAKSARKKPILRAGASMTVGKIIMPALVGAWKQKIEGLECYVRVANTAEIERGIAGGALDFGIVEGRISGSVEAKKFGGDRLAAVCSPSFCAPESTDAEGISRLPLLLREKGSASRDLLDGELAKFALAAKPVTEANTNDALIAAAIAGQGIAVLPCDLVEEYISRGQLREVRLCGVELDRVWFVVWRKGKKFTPAHRLALDICLSRDY